MAPEGAEILVLGALHLDVVVTAPRLPRLDETLRGTSVAWPLGGKGGNQAVAAALMGARVAMAGRVGTDAAGATLLAALDAAGVDRTAVARAPGPSGMSVAIVTEGGAYGAVIVSGANAAIDGSELVIPPAARILLLQNEVPEPANFAAARTARDRGLTVILNAAPARPASPDLLSLTDILVVNRVEAADLTGVTPEALDPDTAAVRILTGGPRAVILTLGEAGAVLAEAGRAPRHLPAFPVRALSSHGAGDAFLGALASELAAGACLDHALTFGQAAAARHVSTPTADRATVTRASVSALAATAT